MIKKYTIENISQVISKRTFPTVTMWNRLEGRPRKDDFDRALKAEIRDPLWMLTKQWQTGEFMGDDAGSPAGAKVHLKSTMLNKFKPSGHTARPYESKKEPLEAMVEQRPVPFTILNEKVFSLDIRLALGRHWVKMVKNAISDLTDFFITNGYSITAPANPNEKDDAFILAHREAWQDFAAISGRKIDGYKIYKAIDDGVDIGAGSGHEAEITILASNFKNWVEKFFMQPKNNENAWLPSRLEYQFACSAPEGEEGTDDFNEKIYEAEEYYTGKLDWYNFSISQSDIDMEVSSEELKTDVQDEITNSFIPSNIDYGGMPNTRWWTFENNKTYIGDIKPNTHEIGKLLFSEFTLLYANDWFLLPLSLKAGTISSIKGLVVTNVFGERIWVNPTGKGQDDDWRRWTMYTVNQKGKGVQDADNSLLLLPTVPKIQESQPIEQFVMIRDEIANMVWAIETDINLPSGRKSKAAEAARELYSFYKRLVADSEEENSEEGEPVANIRYKIMNSVPENWIPFIPVHIDENKREIQLQRAAMPRIIPGDDVENIERVRPRSILLREGLDNSPQKAYYLFEEEVLRAGIIVNQSYQRTRWYNGKIFNWLGIRKTTGRGEGSSGLAFDKLVENKTNNS